MLLLVNVLCHVEGATLDISIDAESAILINADTGAILYEKNAHAKMFPASITKIATALYTLHVYGDKLDTPITAEHDSVAWVSKEAKKRSNYTLPPHWLEPDATHMGIKKGEILTLGDLIHGMLISSANDASNVIAHYIGGSVPRFMAEVNAYLKELGCQNTNFCNPHGLHHPDHMTTAYDMSLIAREAMKYPMFRDVVKTVRYTRPQTNKQQPTTLIQGNRLLRKGKLYYPKAVGIKTGWTSDAKNTLVAAAEHKGRTLISVQIKVKERENLFKNAKTMFEAAFSQALVQRVLLKSGPQKYVLKHPEASKPVKTYLNKDICVDFYPAEEPQLSCKLHWHKLHPPIAKDQHVADLQIASSHGKSVQSVPLYSVTDVNESWISWAKNIFSRESSKPVEKTPSKNGKLWKVVGMGAAILLLFGLLLAMRKR